MSHRHLRGPVVPDVGDDILASFPTMVESAGMITRTTSISAGQGLLTQMESAGKPPTPEAPVYLDVDTIVFKADGSKTSGQWNLVPINYVSSYTVISSAVNGRSGAKGASMGKGGYYRVMQHQTDTKPYKRQFFAVGTCWTAAHSGNVDLELYPSGNVSAAPGAKSRITNTDDTNTQVILSGIIPAGQSIQLTLYLHAAAYNAVSVNLSDDEWTNIYVQIMPTIN